MWFQTCGIKHKGYKLQRRELRMNIFCPISLLDVYGKIVMGIFVGRQLSFLLSNSYIDTSVQKTGGPTFPGMIWQTI